ncbi:DUF938 domain-containing protein [Haliangium sp.]|uniref:DUF938 domain-containing protein n=1 Tax=Haliangium sp. TaxID=2663208 RepID=UPI003D0D4DE4
MKRHAPATTRNREAIAEVLEQELSPPCSVLEIASGTGEHVVYFATRLPGLSWQPSDTDAGALASIEAWLEDARTRGQAMDHVAPPVRLDVTEEPWPVDRIDAIFCSNMIHIAPWEACLALLAGAGRLLPEHGALLMYGPYRIDDRPTAPSNEDFDRSLRAQDPRWGLRQLADVAEAAHPHGLVLTRVYDLPANNVVVVFRRG